tara:strand:+ start:466 stop:1083 length:618 start_codon:yes stop_codon:yes gene_type:complete
MSELLANEILKAQKGENSRVVLSESPNFWRNRITNNTNDPDARIFSSYYTNSVVKLGCFNSIASDVLLFLGENHNIDRVTTYLNPCVSHKHDNRLQENWGMSDNGDIVIENDVWIGYGVKIMSGVTIGTGSVIASGSIVTKNIEPYSIVGGIPAKIITKRFSEKIIEKLLKSEWWNIPYKKLEPLEDLLYSKNIKGFLEAVKQIK